MNVQFLPKNYRVDVESGSNLLGLALDNEIKISGICGGRGTCGKCKVLITKGNHQESTMEELNHLTQEERNRGVRLACAVVVKEDMCVIVPQEYQASDATVKIADSRDDNKEDERYGVVFDIGTTSVEAALYNLGSHQEIMRLTKSNPQSAYGADVISRISYSNQGEDNLNQLKRLIHDCCNDIIDEMIDNYGLMPNNKEKRLGKYSENIKMIEYNGIYRCVFLGNTTMSHLFLGESVKGLSRSPFLPAYDGMVSWVNEDKEFNMNSHGDVSILPGLSGQVGSDTLGCILTTDLIHKEGINLIIDIGTNSEVVLGVHGDMICCSSAAGPAFEGASISQGMKATTGGIKSVQIRHEQLELEVIGGGQAIGICGSGIIDIIGELVHTGIIDETGRIVSPTEITSQLRHRIIEGEGNGFLLTEPCSKEPVRIIQRDIREVQMAKAAIYAGIVTLLEEKNLTPSQVDRVYLAGAFGNNINIKNAINIGLLPDIPVDRFEFVGNGSLEGGALYLLSKVSKDEVLKISKNIQHIELANSNYFQELFIQSMNFDRLSSET